MYLTKTSYEVNEISPTLIIIYYIFTFIFYFDYLFILFIYLKYAFFFNTIKNFEIELNFFLNKLGRRSYGEVLAQEDEKALR